MTKNPDRAAVMCRSCSATSSKSDKCSECGALISGNGYAVEAQLQVSTRGRVYKARSPLGIVALKELVFATVPDTKTIELFEREQAVLKQLNHPRIPRFVDSFSLGRRPDVRLYAAQTFVEGFNLELVLEKKRVDEVFATGVARGVLEILSYLHGLSPALIHRDVKPSNIILRKNGTFSLVDFGCVRDLGRSASARSSVAGTFGYMPPEQFARHADARSDLYALGMTLARLLSRRQPADLITEHLEVDFEPYVNASVEFVGFLERLVALKPRDRFSSAVAALEFLDEIAASAKELESLSPPLEQRTLHVRQPVSLLNRMAREDLTPAKANIIWARANSFEGVQGARPWLLHVGGRTFGLHPGAIYTVGRSQEADIVMEKDWQKADTVSRKHATLAVGAHGVRVRDLDSTNGTRAGSLRLEPGIVGLVISEPTTMMFGKVVALLEPWHKG